MAPLPVVGPWREKKESNRVSGCVGFRLRDGLKSRYIPFQCPSSHSKWRTRWFYLQIENSDPVFVVPEEQPDKISSWTAKPTLTPSLQSFIDVIDDLRVRGLSGYEVAADFVGRRIQSLQARAHLAFDYSGPEDTTQVSPRGLSSEAVGRRVGQVMISGPTMASNVPVLLCEKGAAERDAAINVAVSLKEKVAKEASDAAAVAATTSGGDVPKKGRKFSSVIGHRRKAPTPSPSCRAARAKAAQDGSGGTSSASPAVASTDVVVVPGSHEATPSGPASDLVAGHGSPAAVLTWEELQVEMWRLLEAGARGIGREIMEVRAAAASSSANERADRLAHDLAEAREDLKKMRKLVAGNERQRQGLEHRMSELENNLSEIRGSLRVTYTGLHQLAGECGIKSTIPANPNEFSLTSSLAELAAAMEEIPSKHAARIGEETSNGNYTGACHVLADVDVEDVQQRGQPESPAIIPALAFEPHASPDDVDQILPARMGMAMTSLDLESALAGQDRRIQYWKMKFEVAELERTMLEVKKEQAVETL
uniref:Retrotransposon protein, putative, unclassified n=2 Tax=Oryza sativa subsp. japonica TaxID=39947 RepID=Q53LQ1_ORYSJ|nr:retrotransposon protein, putative, unclassified [Oryza sativa Japonica Group]ABA91941.1 retrotransposon protein, putative, unclassified [Oryza sativa Japonica Group]